MSTTIIATERVPIEQLTPHPQNARKGDIEQIKASLLAHGQYRTIVANKRTNEVLAGNHTFLAAKDLGFDAVEVNWVDADEDAALRILVVDNRLSDLAFYDEPAHAANLEKLMLKGLLEGTGYDPDQVDDVLSGLDALPEVDAETDAQYAESAEETAARYQAPDAVTPMRQIVLLYPQEKGAEVESMCKVLMTVWGLGSVRDVVAEALSRAVDAENEG